MEGAGVDVCVWIPGADKDGVSGSGRQIGALRNLTRNRSGKHGERLPCLQVKHAADLPTAEPVCPGAVVQHGDIPGVIEDQAVRDVEIGAAIVVAQEVVGGLRQGIARGDDLAKAGGGDAAGQTV